MASSIGKMEDARGETGGTVPAGRGDGSEGRSKENNACLDPASKNEGKSVFWRRLTYRARRRRACRRIMAAEGRRWLPAHPLFFSRSHG